MNRTIFFDRVRGSLFDGTLIQSQVDGMTAILDEWDAAMSGDDPRWLGYGFATAYHETGRTMQPIREWGRGADEPYGKPDPVTHQVYYGRGFVQLTWKGNYALQARKLGVDLVNNPDLALQPNIAAKILLLGMRDGNFTGRRFATYFNATTDDPFNARRIVNGIDRAALIAGYYRLFHAAVIAAL